MRTGTNCVSSAAVRVHGYLGPLLSLLTLDTAIALATPRVALCLQLFYHRFLSVSFFKIILISLTSWTARILFLRELRKELSSVDLEKHPSPRDHEIRTRAKKLPLEVESLRKTFDSSLPFCGKYLSRCQAGVVDLPAAGINRGKDFVKRCAIRNNAPASIVERRIKRTLVMVNLVSRRLVINRCWRKIDRYLLTVDDSTFFRADTSSTARFRLRLCSSPLYPFCLSEATCMSVSFAGRSFGTFRTLTWHSCPGTGTSCVGQF